MITCKKCGTKNHDTAKFCAVCGAPLGKSGNGRKRAGRTALIVLLAILVLGGGAAAGWWFFLRDDFTAYYQPFSQEDLRYENGELFVDSQLLVTAKEGVSRRTVEKLAADQGGQVVGYISISNDYQIAFPEGKTAEELAAIADQWSADQDIEAAELHCVTELAPLSVDYTTDPWTVVGEPSYWENVKIADDGGWDALHPNGNNWWAEAIWLPSVWETDIDFHTVGVGVADSAFDLTHREIADRFVRSKVYQNPGAADESTTEHGTAVAGIIAARNDDFGICGVAQNAELYGFSYEGNHSQRYTASTRSPIEMKYAFALFLNDGAKVISHSQAFTNEFAYSAQADAQAGLTEETSVALKHAAYWNDSMEEFLKKCVSKYDFLLVQGAGNEENVIYAKNEKPNEKHAYSYIYTRQSKEKTCTVSTRYQLFGGIEDKEVRDHIIYVGALELKQNKKDPSLNRCQIAEYSNSEGVDVFAPGTNILSAYPGDQVSFFDGTSAATPVVSGIAALVWGVNPDLTGPQVKQILIDSCGTSSLHERMVNALSSVEQALATLKDKGTSPKSGQKSVGTLIGYAYDRKSDTNVLMGEQSDESYELHDARFTIYGGGAQAVRPELAPDGTFTELLTPGDYIVSVRADGFTPVDEMVTIKPGEVTYLSVSMARPAVSVSFERAYTEKDVDGQSQGFEYGILTGLDRAGDEVWTVQSKDCGRESYDVVFPVGERDGVYYYVEDGEVVALDMAYGDELWHIGSLGDVSDAVLAENGNIYLCCMDEGPDFVGLSGGGEILGKVEDFDQEYNDFDAVEYETGFAKVHPFNPGDEQVVYYVDVSDYSWYRTAAWEGDEFWKDKSAPQPAPNVPDLGDAPEDAAYQQLLETGGYYWEVTCLKDPEYVLFDVDQNGVKELIIRGELLNGYYGQNYDEPNYQNMYYTFQYTDGAVTYQGRQEYLPLGCDNAQLAEMTFAPFDLVYNYTFTPEELSAIAAGLGAPSGVEIREYKVSGGPNYWAGTNSWTVDMELWGSDGGYASSGVVLGSTTVAHMWVPWVYQ